MLMSLLSRIAGGLGNNMELLLGVLINSFQSLTFIGESLIYGIVFVASSISTILLFFVNGIAVILSEFYFFLRDIADLKDELCHFLETGLKKCSILVLTVLNSIQDFSSCVYLTIWGMLDAVFQIVVSVAVFINSFLHLIGRSFIVLLHAIFFDSCTLAINILHAGRTLIVNVFSYIAKFCCISLNFVLSIVLAFKHMPITSCLGLLVVITTLVLGKLYFSQMTRTAKSALLCAQVTAWQLLKDVRNLLGYFLKRLKKRRASPASGATEDVKPGANSNDLLRQLELEREEKLCVVCRDRMRLFVLLPCRHYCLCQTCLDAILSRHASCPICRHYVYDSWKIYS